MKLLSRSKFWWKKNLQMNSNLFYWLLKGKSQCNLLSAQRNSREGIPRIFCTVFNSESESLIRVNYSEKHLDFKINFNAIIQSRTILFHFLLVLIKVMASLISKRTQKKKLFFLAKKNLLNASNVHKAANLQLVNYTLTRIGIPMGDYTPTMSNSEKKIRSKTHTQH